MESSRKMLFGILILSVFVFIISIISLYVQVTIETGDACGCLIPLPFFIPFVGSTGLFIGTLVYYLFTPRFDRRHARPDIELLMSLLGDNEALVMNRLAENRGELSQATLVKLTGLSKVRLFRTLERMKSKNLIEKRPKGKTNMVFLTEGFRKLLMDMQ
jgi:DNA-binding MarR family transcriptional regulator